MLLLNNATVYVLELTVGVESNISLNRDREVSKYHPLIASLQKSYSAVKFVDLSLSALGIYGTSAESFLSMLADSQVHEKTKKNALLKSINIRCGSRENYDCLANGRGPQLTHAQ